MTKDKSVIKGWNHLPQHISKVTFDKIEKALQITAKVKGEEGDKILEKTCFKADDELADKDEQIKQLQKDLERLSKRYYQSKIQSSKKTIEIDKLQKENEELRDVMIAWKEARLRLDLMYNDLEMKYKQLKKDDKRKMS